MTHEHDWVEGFLLVGNQPALDLLNTELLDGGETLELLPDVPALIRWLSVAGLVGAADAKRALQDPVAAERFRRKLLAFRDALRRAVFHLEAGRSPGAEFLAALNRLLEEHPTRLRVSWSGGQASVSRVLATEEPDDLWAVIAAATTALLTEVPASRVRKCESCIVHFHDVSKKGGRRWCSMKLCGNKVKVAAYQSRRRNPVA
jgi:predicted RNA-binding Zn ribbon-like protein